MGFGYTRGGCKQEAGNMKSIVDHREVMERYIRGEKEAGRLMGLFPKDTCFQEYMSGHLEKSQNVRRTSGG